MHNIVNNLLSIQSEIKLKINELNFKNYQPNIVAVSKTFSMQDILPLINHGHIHFGENKVQEAIEKWTNLKNDFKHLKLHMVGKLQTNKVKYVVPLFDYIHSVDNIKLAEKISQEQIKNNKKMKLFIQINIGNEDQKTGISEDRLENFFNICTKELDLNVIPKLKIRYPWARIGYSGHEEGISACLIAKVLGAEVFEKHITLSRSMWGTDQAASLVYDQLWRLVRDLKKVDVWKGTDNIEVYNSEKLLMEKFR